MKQKRELGRKLLSFLLTLALVLGLVPGMGMTAKAESAPVTYLDASGNSQTCATYTVVTDNTTSWSAGWYVVNSNVTINSTARFFGDVNIILCDNAKLTFAPADGSAFFTDVGSLTIYAQSTGNNMGELVASSNGNYTIKTLYGNITINGGKVTATAYGSNDTCMAVAAYSGNVIINGGIISATGYKNGICAGNFGDYVEINGGTVTALATQSSAIGGKVKNKNAGFGWADASDNGDGTTIAVSETGQTLSNYKKVQFVAPAQTQTHTHDGNSFTAWTSNNSLPTTDGYYYLTNDVTLSNAWEVGENITITLCLNGHGITANHNDPAINVAHSSSGGNGGNLTLVDDNGAGSTHYYYIDENGRGHIVDQNNENYRNASDDKKGSFTGGYITVADDKSGTYSDGIVDIKNNASFTMKGGTIIGGPKRGVNIAGSSFTMSAGNIIGNREGGVCANFSNSVFNMEGGVISYNNQYGVDNRGTFKVSGKPTITKNKNSNVACNVLVKSDNKLTIGGTLNNTSPIGVTMDQPGVFTSSPNTEKAKDFAAKFKSDSDSYTVKVVGDELKLALSQEHDKANAVAATVTANNCTYDGTDKPLVTVTGEATGGTMQYATGTDATTAPTSGWSTSIPTATDAGTYYVWYKVVGDADHSDSEAKCLTVIISNKSSGGGSYTPSTPSTPTTPSSTSAPAPTAAPTEDYTVPVTNEKAVNVSTSITEGNAVVEEITQSDLDKIVNKSSEPGTEANENTSITIDVSKAKSEVTSIELTKTTIERLADTTSEQNNNVDTVTVQMTNAKVELDAETLAAVSEQADGNRVRLVVDDKLEQASLNEKQRDVISTYEKATTFEAYFESDGKRIHDFKGGTAKVSVRYSLMSGLLARFIHMLYLNPTGEVERFTTTYDGEWCTGDLPHFSEYAIVYDTSVSNKTGTEEDAAEAEKIAKDPYSGLDPEDWDADENDFVADEMTILPNGKTAYENGLAINSGLRLIQKGKTLTVTWGKVKGATGYKIYTEYCGTKMPDKPIKTIKNGSKVKVVIKKLHGKKLNKKNNYKVCVVAYKTVNGVDKVLGRTVTAHVVGAKNKKYSNPKKLTIVSKTKLSLKQGKSAKIRSKVTLVDKKRKSLSDAHAPMFRYASTNKKVATVNKKGKIKAVGKGQCYIWVYAKNGYGKKVKVTVS